jgi:hypothetical protein
VVTSRSDSQRSGPNATTPSSGNATSLADRLALQQHQVGRVGHRGGLRMQVGQHVQGRPPWRSWRKELLRDGSAVVHDQQWGVFRGARQLDWRQPAYLRKGGGTTVGALAGGSGEFLPGIGSVGGDDHPGAGGHRAQGDLSRQVEPTDQNQPGRLRAQH